MGSLGRFGALTRSAVSSDFELAGNPNSMRGSQVGKNVWGANHGLKVCVLFVRDEPIG